MGKQTGTSRPKEVTRDLSGGQRLNFRSGCVALTRPLFFSTDALSAPQPESQQPVASQIPAPTCPRTPPAPEVQQTNSYETKTRFSVSNSKVMNCLVFPPPSGSGPTFNPGRRGKVLGTGQRYAWNTRGWSVHVKHLSCYFFVSLH